MFGRCNAICNIVLYSAVLWHNPTIITIVNSVTNNQIDLLPSRTIFKRLVSISATTGHHLSGEHVDLTDVVPDLTRDAIVMTPREYYGISDHRQHDSLFNSLFDLTTKTTSKLRIAGLL